VDITRKICAFLPDSWESHRIYYGFARSSIDSENIDEVLVGLFAKGKSFTGEETAEITCHGNPVLVESLLQELISAGCSLAQPGEFTYRAFLHGRIDLIQAESVLSLIEGESRQATKLALRQLKGDLSGCLAHLESELTWIGAHLEASIDFSTEDIEILTTYEVSARLTSVIQSVEKLLATYRLGRQVRDGLRVALVGRPNVGKSSLHNRILSEERAIVTSLPGTTRDLVEGELILNGTRFVFVDMAGLRVTSDLVETLGIERARGAIDEADIVFLVLDGSAGIEIEDVEIMMSLKGRPGALVFNKMDTSAIAERVLLEDTDVVDFCQSLVGIEKLPLFLSAKTGQGVEDLMLRLSQNVEVAVPETAAIISQARHFEGLSDILACLKRGLKMLKEGVSPEFPAFELLSAVRTIHEVQGKEYSDQVMDRVFREFCLGK
jgi:tRNA modification GTPase